MWRHSLMHEEEEEEERRRRRLCKLPLAAADKLWL
jgi:hypothetical protein